MDFRTVEKRYRTSALCWQAVLLICLFAYIVFQLLTIVSSANDPPIETTLKAWDGAGEWALCTHPNSPLYGAGFAVYEGDHFSRDEAGKKWPVREESIEDVGHCARIDLTQWKWEKKETMLRVCLQAPSGVSFYIKSNDNWKYFGHTSTKGEVLRYSYKKSKHGWNYGYTSTVEDFHELIQQEREPIAWNGGTGACKHWTFFGEERGIVDAAFISIQSPMVQVSKKQGVLPQIFKLVGEVGGWMAVLSMMFTAMFVKMYTDSPVAKIYEARTFIGERIGLSMSEHGKQEKETDVNSPSAMKLPPGMFPHLDTE